MSFALKYFSNVSLAVFIWTAALIIVTVVILSSLLTSIPLIDEKNWISFSGAIKDVLSLSTVSSMASNFSYLIVFCSKDSSLYLDLLVILYRFVASIFSHDNTERLLNDTVWLLSFDKFTSLMVARKTGGTIINDNNTIITRNNHASQ